MFCWVQRRHFFLIVASLNPIVVSPVLTAIPNWGDTEEKAGYAWSYLKNAVFMHMFTEPSIVTLHLTLSNLAGCHLWRPPQTWHLIGRCSSTGAESNAAEKTGATRSTLLHDRDDYDIV